MPDVIIPPPPAVEPITKPNPVAPSWLSKVLEVLASPTVRRLLVFAASLVLNAMNKKWGLDLSVETLFGVDAVTGVYLAQSAHTEASKARSDALVAASRPQSP